MEIILLFLLLVLLLSVVGAKFLVASNLTESKSSVKEDLPEPKLDDSSLISEKILDGGSILESGKIFFWDSLKEKVVVSCWTLSSVI